MKNKLSIKNALIGLGGLVAVVAPVATLVACGGSTNVEQKSSPIRPEGITKRTSMGTRTSDGNSKNNQVSKKNR